jgi:hypothetical protein
VLDLVEPVADFWLASARDQGQNDRTDENLSSSLGSALVPDIIPTSRLPHDRVALASHDVRFGKNASVRGQRLVFALAVPGLT